MTEQPHERSRLGRIAVIVAVLAGLATIAGVAWTIFYRQGTEVADYRREASATCQDVRAILSGFPPGAITFGPGGPTIANKRSLLAALHTRLQLARTAFETLKAKPPPGELRGAYDSVLTSQDAWYTAFEQNIEAVRARLRRGDPVERIGELGVEVGFADATLRLNNAMSALGAEPCHITGGTQT